MPSELTGRARGLVAPRWHADLVARVFIKGFSAQVSLMLFKAGLIPADRCCLPYLCSYASTSLPKGFGEAEISKTVDHSRTHCNAVSSHVTLIIASSCKYWRLLDAWELRTM